MRGDDRDGGKTGGEGAHKQRMRHVEGASFGSIGGARAERQGSALAKTLAIQGFAAGVGDLVNFFTKSV